MKLPPSHRTMDRMLYVLCAVFLFAIVWRAGEYWLG